MEISNVFSTKELPAIILIRLIVGCTFLSEGIQKFIYEELGAGRFSKIGLPWPEYLAPFVGINEISFGVLILLGFATRLATIPLLAIIITAIVSTKIPIVSDKGFWPMAHEARTDFAMLLSLMFLLIEGAGPWSLDIHWKKLKARK